MLIDRARRLGFFLLLATILSSAISISLFEISSVLFMALTIFLLIGDPAGRKRALGGPWMVFFAVYFAANLLSLTQSQYMGDSLKGLLRVFRSILLCVSVIYTLDSEEKLLAAFRWALGVAFLIALDGLAQSIIGKDLIRQRPLTNFHGETGRVTATFGQANDFSGWLTLPVFFYLGVIAEARNLKLSRGLAAGLLAGFAALLACLIWTYSRGAWVSVAAAFFLFAVLKRKKILLAGMALVLIWAAFLSPPLLKQRVQSLANPTGGTFKERQVLAGEAITMIKTSPWLGMGLNTFSKNAPAFKSKEHYTDLEYLHNGYLQMAVETGVIGAGTFILVALHFFAAGFGLFATRAATLAQAAGSGIYFGIAAFLAHSAMDTNLHSLLLVSAFWLALGMGWSAIQILRRRAV